jgi:hypothetical protein
VRRFSAALEVGDLETAAAELAPNVEIDDRDIPDADGHDYDQAEALAASGLDRDQES